MKWSIQKSLKMSSRQLLKVILLSRKYEIKVSDRGQRHIEKKAENFGISEDEVVVRTLNSHIRQNKELAADLYLDDEIDEEQVSEYFDEEEMEQLRLSKDKVQDLKQKGGVE